VVAVVGVDAELADDLVGVFAPVLDVNEGVVQRRAVVAGEGVDLAEDLGGGEDVGGDDLFEQAGELGIGEADAASVRRTRLRASNFSRKFFSSEARSWMSGRSVYLRSRSFWMNRSSMPASLRASGSRSGGSL
jgi:hypothetical protein